jgi:Ca2+-binding RTX toxin-like protein
MRRWSVLLVVLLGLVAGPNAGAAVSTCTYNASTKVVTMTMVEEFGAQVSRSGNRILYVASNNPIPCGAARVGNTNRIDIKGTGASADTIAANYVTIDLQGGVLGPGKKAEATGKSEIEVRVAVLPGIDPFFPNPRFPLALQYVGTNGPDRVVVGTKGMDLNGDGDVDVTTTLTPFGLYSFYGVNGKDVMSAGGSKATGKAVTKAASFHDGNGDDTVTGGRAGDSFLGEPGNDIQSGGAGNDTFYSGFPDGRDRIAGGAGFDTANYEDRGVGLSISLDRKANDGWAGEKDNVGTDNGIDAVIGGSAGNTLTGNALGNMLSGGAGADTITGRDGMDFLYGYGGNDTLNALDGFPDVVDGGADTDTATVDSSDDVSNVEATALHGRGRTG